jgi:hypothetical protein
MRELTVVALFSCMLSCVGPPATTAATAGPLAGTNLLSAAPPTPAGGRTGIVEYYGGPVVSKMQALSILWGPNVDPATVAGIPEYLSALVNSTYVDQLSIYDTFLRGVNGHKGTRQRIKRGFYIGQIEITPENTSTQLSDADIVAELKHQIAIGVLPTQTLNTWYTIYFPAGISIFLPGYGYSCSSWVAYHWSSRRRRPAQNNIYYAVEPHCGGGFDQITWTTSHEFAETVTDPIAPASTPGYPAAWVTPGNQEIGDLCQGSYGSLSDGVKSYLVQQEYLDSIGGCSTGNYTSP